jgi:hypothetical protein
MEWSHHLRSEYYVTSSSLISDSVIVDLYGSLPVAVTLDQVRFTVETQMIATVSAEVVQSTTTL